MDEQVADTLSILSAEPTEIEMCRGYQNEFIGQYVSTNFGLVNACEPGLGKTVMALKSAELLAQRKAEEGDDGRYRMLVLVNASLRTQWARESERFADGFEVITVRSKRDADDLQAALDDDESTEPLIVVCSYSLARRVITTLDDHEGDVDPIGQALASVHWDDVVPDEAQGLRTTGSQLYRAMWMLRERTRRGLPLTGTPMSKGVDDLGRLISWARSEPDMFHGVRLSQQFDLTTEAGRDAFLEAVGPVMFRRDKSEISDELPNLDTQVVFLDPSFDEAQLARKAKDGLKEEYTELVDTIAELERLNPDDERFAQMRERLTMAKDAVRTSRSVARKAASDPVALINSEQTAAKLLAGYINKAAEKPGTKRIWCVDYVEDLVDDGEQVVIFTEYPAVADALVADLEERDIAVGKVAGSGGRTRDRHVTEFQEGVRRVVVCTKAGEQGLNLQNASTLINYDVPWLPDRILQRLGRIERIGATSEKLKVVFPIMAETIEERVAAIVVARVSAQLQALDASRGIDLNDTSTGKTFANLAHSVNLDELDDDNAKLVEITRLVLDETVSTDEYDEVDERMDAEIAAAEEAVPA